MYGHRSGQTQTPPASRVSSASTSKIRPLSAPVFAHESPHSSSRAIIKPMYTDLEASISEQQESPLKQRLQCLSGRLTTLQKDKEDEKLARREAWEAQIRVLEEKLSRVTASDSTKLKLWKDDLDKTTLALQVEREARQMLEERKKKEIKAVESSIQHELALQQQMRKDTMEKLEGEVKDPKVRISVELTASAQKRDEGEAKRASILREEVSQLGADVALTVQLRQATEMRVGKALADEISRLQDMLKSERRARDVMEHSMKNMLHDIEADLRRAIQEQAQQRIAMEENLMRLLEDTATRIEFALSSV